MKNNIIELLDYIDPSALDYQEWVNVGMALKHEGCDCSVWEEWSSRDVARYHSGECQKKWNTFNGSASPVTGGTVYQLATRFGFSPSRDEAMEWGDEIGRDSFVILDGIEVDELEIPREWSPKAQIIKYLDTLFDADENVGYVTDCWQNDDGRNLPKKGSYDRTAGQLIQELSRLEDDDIGAVFGDYNPEVGAWIRFNPLDGQGVKNSNVTDFRYALVESDSVDISTQNTLIRELELPVAALVYSGGKSVHAIVRVDAADAAEYRKRVEYLYTVCKKNGLAVDEQNKNPSRLSRMPGVMRNGKKQYLLDINIGKQSWAQWYEWVESVNDDLPDFENLKDLDFNNLPALSEPLIDGILRKGHKMLIAGPSKAGKSFALIELAVAIAEGRSWLGFNCTQGKVLYLNLEVDKASFLHRLAAVYQTLHWKPNSIGNITIWHLRGKSAPMDKLTPKLVRRAVKEGYTAIIIDPIYKVLTGDENSAEQMSRFCNEFDKICSQLGCAVIYCHHHSKGAQGEKSSMDRASGSGVFARDPDALLDLIELPLEDSVKEQQAQRGECEIYMKYLRRFVTDADDLVSQDDALSAAKMREIAAAHLPKATLEIASEEAQEAKKAADTLSGWRIEGTLREFPKLKPVNCWFRHPVHIVDDTGILSDIAPRVNSKNSPWGKNFERQSSKEDKKKKRLDSLETAFNTVQENGRADIKSIAEYLNVEEKTVRRYIKEHGGFWVDNGETGYKDKDKTE